MYVGANHVGERIPHTRLYISVSLNFTLKSDVKVSHRKRLTNMLTLMLTEKIPPPIYWEEVLND